MHKVWIAAICVGALFTVGAALAMSPEARQSFEAFERRAEEGDAEAQYRLSALLETGFDSIPADTVRSLSLLRRSADAGYAPALNYMGFLFQKGGILPADPDSARYYIRKAADRGDNLAAHNFAYLLLNEDDDASNDSLAVEYLRKAAQAGMPQSQTLLADLYAGGKVLAADRNAAIRLYEDAIARGFHDAELRLLNMMGPEWQKLNAAEALSEAKRYWIMGAPTIAVELLHQIGPYEPETAQAYALLGHAYSRGQGAPYDHRRANEYFARAAIMGNPSAQFILSETLEIFPDALQDLLPDLPDSMTPESLRQSAAKAGILSPEQASAALFK